MQKSLLSLINQLKGKKQVLRRQCQKLFLDPNGQEKKEAYEQEIEKINDILLEISKKFVMSAYGLEKIISKKTGKEHKLKIFCETYEKDGKTYLSHRFVVCYLSKDDEFFNYPTTSSYKEKELNGNYVYENISIPETDYKKLIQSLIESKALIPMQSQRFDTFSPSPSTSFNGLNFVDMLLFNYPLSRIELSFKQIITPWINEVLEQIIVDENLNPVNAKTDEATC